MREPFGIAINLRIPSALADRLDATAARYARTKSDIVREAMVIGLGHIAERLPASDDTPKAA